MSVTNILIALTALLGATGLGGLLKTWLDHQRGKRKQTDDVAMGLVEKLEQRVDKLEATIERKDAEHSGEVAILRHRISNQRTIIYSLLHLFDVPAARRKDMLANIRSELAAIEQAEATEKAVIVAAKIKEPEA